MIDTISFDLDDTLWDNKPVIIAAEQQLTDWVTQYAPLLAPHYNLQNMLQYRSIILQQQPQLRHRISRLREAVLCYALQQHGYDIQQSATLAAAGFSIFLQARHRIEPYHQAAPLLASLSRNYTLIALTNGNADVNQLPLGQYFSHSYRSEQLDRAKPDPDFYHVALNNAGLDPARTLHIGDDYKNDVQAAREAGLMALWFNPSQQSCEGASAEIEVRALEEIPAAIERFINKAALSS